ncbi:hypothetical protein EV193_11115 [Herbihabitans rhizosphaerae]|uniref:Uncharacterized protein n=1 Tax=Herbihabitans rhizosphaerae TaxID=1872711 RepID=A0A4V2ERP2_9PSEU|nr:hypothetical protein EV193_11115 [Herbihabitans rhizosphaerae]
MRSAPLKWKTLDRTTFQTTWHDGRTWTLKATPEGKYPWALFTDENSKHPGAAIEIGNREMTAARHNAESWLDQASLLPSDHQYRVW